MFEDKKKRKFQPRRMVAQRRFNIHAEMRRNSTSVQGRGSETSTRRLELLQNSTKKNITYYNQEKPEALTFEDFIRIEFIGGKPEFFVDFISYMTGHNLYTLLSLLPNDPERRLSEEIINEVTAGGIHELTSLADDPNYQYYTDLETAMKLFSEDKQKSLLQKFRFL